MSEVYELSSYGTPGPLSLDEVKEHLRLDDESEDASVTILLDAALIYVEGWTGREMRANTWTLHLDSWPANARICLRRSPVDTVTSIKRLVYAEGTGLDTLTTVTAADYYLKPGVDFTEVLLFDTPTGSAKTGEWPDDLSEQQLERRIEVLFVTQAHSSIDLLKGGVLHLMGALWENRGDCLIGSAVSGWVLADLFRQCGAAGLLQSVRIPRI